MVIQCIEQQFLHELSFVVVFEGEGLWLLGDNSCCDCEEWVSLRAEVSEETILLMMLLELRRGGETHKLLVPPPTPSTSRDSVVMVSMEVLLGVVTSLGDTRGRKVLLRSITCNHPRKR